MTLFPRLRHWWRSRWKFQEPIVTWKRMKELNKIPNEEIRAGLIRATGVSRESCTASRADVRVRLRLTVKGND